MGQPKSRGANLTPPPPRPVSLSKGLVMTPTERGPDRDLPSDLTPAPRPLPRPFMSILCPSYLPHWGCGVPFVCRVHPRCSTALPQAHDRSTNTPLLPVWPGRAVCASSAPRPQREVRGRGQADHPRSRFPPHL